jgi:hypothetical protein
MNEKIYNVNDELPEGKIRVRDTDGQIYHVIKDSRTTSFFKDSKYSIHHRIIGPAVIEEGDDESYYEWFQNNRYHRLDGPAYEEVVGAGQGIEQWIIDDVHITSTRRGRYRGTDVLQKKLDKLE